GVGAGRRMVGLRLLWDEQVIVVRAEVCCCPRHQQERLPGTEGVRLDEVGCDGHGHGQLTLRIRRGVSPPWTIRELEVAGRVRAAVEMSAISRRSGIFD